MGMEDIRTMELANFYLFYLGGLGIIPGSERNDILSGYDKRRSYPLLVMDLFAFWARILGIMRGILIFNHLNRLVS